MACGGGSQEMPDVDATVALPIDGLEEFNEAIKLNPDNADAYYNRGVTYRKLGQHERAIEDYNEAIRLRPQFAFPYYNRGLSYRELCQNEQAERDFAKVKKLG
jgi:tetratricopeptide (TPR) repeat protein